MASNLELLICGFLQGFHEEVNDSQTGQSEDYLIDARAFIELLASKKLRIQ